MSHILDGIPTLCIAKDAPETGSVWSVFMEPRHLVATAQKLYEVEYVLESILALDVAEGLVVIYHFNQLMRNERIAVKVLIPADKPALPSLCSVYDGAEWHEREVRDFHGVQFDGNTNFAPLLMPADNADLFPLLKTDKSRKALSAVMNMGEIVSITPEIAALFNITEEEA